MQQYSGDTSGQHLAELFSRNLHLSGHGNDEWTGLQPGPVVPEEKAAEQAPQFNYSISQHYTHSAHIVKTPSIVVPVSTTIKESSDIRFPNGTISQQCTESVQNSDVVNKFSIPAMKSPNIGLSIYQTLAQNHVPVDSLLPSQVTLFEQADDDQRSRLIQLWSISPGVTLGCQGTADGIDDYQNVTIEREEEQALARWKEILSSDMDLEVAQACVHICLSNREPTQAAEVYMKSGYEQLAERDYQKQERGFVNVAPAIGGMISIPYKQATDPVYQAKWQFDNMEHEYAMYDQLTTDTVVIHEPEDEEML